MQFRLVPTHSKQKQLLGKGEIKMTDQTLLQIRDTILVEGMPVTIFGLGDEKTYPGIVRGKSTDGAIPTYIIEMDYPEHPYSCVAIPASCIRECNPNGLT